MTTTLPPCFVVDRDDTFACCSQIYAAAKDAFFREVATLTGADIDSARNRLADVDLARVTTHGFGPARMSGSMVLVLEELAEANGRRVTDDDRETVREIGMQPAHYTFPPFAGSVATIRRLIAAGARVAMCTKGPLDVQRRKVDLWGDDSLFHHVEICETRKTAVEILAAARGAAPNGWSTLVMVGDSLKDDIAGGKAAGAKTVLVENAAPTWHYNTHGVSPDLVPDATIAALRDLPTVLAMIGLAEFAERVDADSAEFCSDEPLRRPPPAGIGRAA